MRKNLNAQQANREEKFVKKGLVLLMALGLVLALSSVAFAADITPKVYNKTTDELGATKADYTYYEQGKDVNLGAGTIVYNGYADSTHPQGTWNSPYTTGIDGYNYNDPQDYTDAGAMTGDMIAKEFPVHPAFAQPVGAMLGLMGMGDGSPMTTVTAQMRSAYTSGPHGGYLTSTHKCRECHAVHRAAGKFKLTRANSRYEACDWCHGTGAGSGYNIQMDNNDSYTREYNVGHSMGFGIQNGKWKAPDDTYPAFTPPYWQGGFSCFDCHSPHANPARIMGFDNNAEPIPSIIRLQTGQVFNIGNPGHDMNMSSTDPNVDHAQVNDWVVGLGGPIPKAKPYFQAGSWLLLKNPDKELNEGSTFTATSPIKDMVLTAPTGWDPFSGSFNIATSYDRSAPASWVVAPKQEISDKITAAVDGYAVASGIAGNYPVNKLATDWNDPIGSASMWDFTNMFGFLPPSNNYGIDVRNPLCRSVMMSEFCTDCHDGNAGLHDVATPMFSEDRALRDQGAEASNWAGNYDLAYGHDSASRHCGRSQKFNPEDGQIGGPHCRNCHKGSSGCSSCHNGNQIPVHYEGLYTTDTAAAASNSRTAVTSFFARAFEMVAELDNYQPMIADPQPGWGANWTQYTQGLVGMMGMPGIPESLPLLGVSTYKMSSTSDGQANQVSQVITTPIENSDMVKNSRTAAWTAGWRTSPAINSATCSDDGLSWPHRTLGWKMLKDDLFGIDVTGRTDGESTVIGVGVTRTFSAFTGKPGSLGALAGNGVTVTHDLDSVCLDCHNPTVWNATATNDHVDNPADPNDDMDDELLLRGLP